jgi:hypothetical protein
MYTVIRKNKEGANLKPRSKNRLTNTNNSKARYKNSLTNTNNSKPRSKNSLTNTNNSKAKQGAELVTEMLCSPAKDELAKTAADANNVRLVNFLTGCCSSNYVGQLTRSP